MSPVLRCYYLAHTTVIIPGYSVESVFDGLDTVVEVGSLAMPLAFFNSFLTALSDRKIESSCESNRARSTSISAGFR